MRTDKQAAKHKKRRELARKKSKSETSRTGGEIARFAARARFGPAFLSREWSDGSLPPRILTAIVTRMLPDASCLVQIMLVDRTCLGVKNAFCIGPIDSRQLGELVERAGAAHPEPLEPVEVTLMQSVVLHAIAYAASLGFAPHPDFDPKLLGAPDALVPTPLARPARPFYVPGPDDDVDAIVATLAEHVGEGGYDLAEQHAVERAPDEAVLHEGIEAWLGAADGDARFDQTAAFGAYIHAVNGRPPRRGDTIDEEHLTSLPNFWSILFRPLDAQRTGLDLAWGAKSMARYRSALESLRRTRATLFDVLGVDLDHDIAICRDVFDGSLLRVRMDRPTLAASTRWTRFFGYLTPMPDGSMYPPSSLLGHIWLRNTDPITILERLNELLAELGVAERVDPASPYVGMTRFGALLYGVLRRSIAPTPEQASERDQPIFCVNGDGERFEAHEAQLAPAARVASKLRTALAAADDFVEQGPDRFAWFAESPDSDEPRANVSVLRDRTLTVFANSAGRFERVIARLSELAGVRLEPKRLEIMRPWESNPKMVAEETPGCRKLVMSARAIETDDPAQAPAGFVVASLLRALDEHVPMLEGTPRKLVATAAGRRAVEAWIAEQELRGTPGDAGAAFLDLDEVRLALGLPGTLG